MDILRKTARRLFLSLGCQSAPLTSSRLMGLSAAQICDAYLPVPFDIKTLKYLGFPKC